MKKNNFSSFGKDVVHIRELDGKGINAVTGISGTIGFIFNLLWLISFGWVLFFLNVIDFLQKCQHVFHHIFFLYF